MGRPVTLLLAAVLVAGAPILAQASALEPVEVDVETSVAEAHVNTSGLVGNSSVEGTPGNASEANASVAVNASSGDERVEVTTNETSAQANASLSMTEMTVRVGPGQLAEVTYTPPGLAEVLGEVPATTDAEDPVADDEEPQRSSQEPASPADGGEELGLAWTVAPVAGVAAAAAAGHALPAGAWLRRLLGAAPLAPLYSRIPRDDLLDHESRAAIYELLEEKAGLSLETICQELELARSTARHHVRKLEEADMVEHTKLGRARVHHLVGERRRALRRHLLANDTREAVYDAIREGAKTITEVARAIEANPGSVHFHLQKLVDGGLVERVADSKRYRAVDVEPEEPVFEPV